MLVPTIGLVQVSSQAMADRYSYLPSVGLLIMVAWSVRDWVGDRVLPRAAASLAGGAAVMACMALTPAQIQHWRNTRTIFTWAVGVTDQNYRTYYNRGCEAMEKGQCLQAISDFNQALSSELDKSPWADHSRAYNDLGYAYLHEGQVSNAVANFEMALSIKPKYPEAYFNMGRAFMTNNQPEVAVDCFQHALALDQNPVVLGALAAAYARMGNFAGAVAAAQQARQLALARKDTTLAAALESQSQMYRTGGGGTHR
jgi:tetratricopeptide (TPR) repeat protein